MKRQAIPFQYWPETDKSAWNAAMFKGDWFDGRGPAAHWSIPSQNSVKAAYGRWLSFIEQHVPDDMSLPLAERVTPDTIEYFINLLGNEVSPATIYIYLNHLLCALGVMTTERDWDWLRTVARRLKRDATPKPKRHKMVDSQRLFALGLSLMEEAEEKHNGNKLATAVLYRDGLLIALLAARPLRRRTLSLIRIGQHIHQIGDHYSLTFAAVDTKNKQAIDFNLPLVLTPCINRYLRYYRGHFANTMHHDGLWASVKGCPLSGDAIYHRIITRTRTAFGFSLNPHLFRDCAATTLAVHKPDLVLTAAGLLGHANLSTIHQHYIHAQTIKAGNQHQANVNRLRKCLDARRNSTL